MLLFIPYGFFASYYIKPKKGLVIFFLTVLTSLLIEVTQAKIGRVFDVDDIILNLCGGITGYFIFRTLDFIKLNVPKILKKGWILNIIIIVLISLFLLYFNNFF